MTFWSITGKDEEQYHEKNYFDLNNLAPECTFIGQSARNTEDAGRSNREIGANSKTPDQSSSGKRSDRPQERKMQRHLGAKPDTFLVKFKNEETSNG